MKVFGLLSVLIGLVIFPSSVGRSQEADPFGAPPTKELSLREKLRKFIIPKIEFEETPLDIALEFLTTRSVELDQGTSDAVGKGINIVLHEGKGADTQLNLKLENVPLGEALKIVARLAGMEAVVQEAAVVIAPPGVVKQVRTPQMIAEEKVNVAALKKKLEEIQIPAVEFQDTPVSVAIGFLAEKSFELDPEKDPNQKGVNFVLNGGELDPELRITLNLKNVSLSEALRYTCDLAGITYELEPHTVVISPAGK